MQRLFFYTIYVCLFLCLACHRKEATAEEEGDSEAVQTPVTVTHVMNEPLSDYIELNATSIFLQDNIIKSNINGYIKAVNTKVGEYAAAGKTLFTLKTKEAESLGNTVNNLDPSFRFSGIVHIKAAQSGYVTELNHQPGDYVQDGEQLAVISNTRSFGFVLNIPYEYRRYIALGKSVDVALPDGTKLTGAVASFMPSIDSASQTVGALIKVNGAASIPENLIAKVRILKSVKEAAFSVPKAAVLTDETQTSFWVMKLIDSVTAVKVPVMKGLETGDRIEIVRPQFSTSDRLLLSGNYGLPDTAKVKIVKAEE